MVVLVLLVWSWWRWADRPDDPVAVFFGMALESCLFAFVLWQFSRNFGPIIDGLGIKLQITVRTAPATQVLTFIGAGIYEEVLFRVGANVDPGRDVLITEGPLDHLDHAPTRQFYGGKLGIDATHKGPAEGTREWPPEIEMTHAVKELVSRRWGEYGIALDASAANGQMRQSAAAKRRLLRR